MNAGGRRELYHFRDEQGLEVDFLLPGKNGALTLIECKATRSPFPGMAANLVRLKEDLRRKQKTRTQVDAVLIHRIGPRATGRALALGVKALSLEEWIG